MKSKVPVGCASGNPNQWQKVECFPDDKIEVKYFSDATCATAATPASAEVKLGKLQKQAFPPGSSTTPWIFDARCFTENGATWFEMWPGSVFKPATSGLQRSGTQEYIEPSDLENNAGGLRQISTGQQVAATYNVDIKPVIKHSNDPGYAKRTVVVNPKKPTTINTNSGASLATLFVGLFMIFAL